MLVLVVETGGRVDGLGHPVDGDSGEELVLGEASFYLPVTVAPGAPLLDNPGCQSHWRIVEPVGQGLGFGPLDMGVSALFYVLLTRFGNY